MGKTLKINKRDNVEINLETGHKHALCDIKCGDNVIKYGYPIGHATEDIKKGEHIHTHNLKTNLEGKLKYTYKHFSQVIKQQKSDLTFMGFRRHDGKIGIRNDIWIVNTVGCVNKIAERLAGLTGALCFVHPYGCSQLGDDQTTTQLILRGMVNHPNAGGVLVLGLGCENNNIDVFKGVLGEYDERRVKFLNCQDFEDEISEGVRLIGELRAYADTFKREPINICELRIGLKCGGSDGYSGITANPLVGAFTEKVTSMGAGCVLTEVPEMFGAEQLLMEHCENEDVFNKTVGLINGFKEYYERHGQVIYENPSPGNKKGGITTLEEKSLGCVQKGGMATVVDVLGYGDTVKKSGLSLLWGPGNDIVAVTNLMAAGVHLILFTTGRGTPLGGAVPTVKIATNKSISEKKSGWIDFDASSLLDGESMESLCDRFTDFIIEIASGKEAKNEINGYREIAIFKDGVTL